ncbi:hypothetical protein SCHPADRAFT_847980 [Schizopora paradoxa]|uniref:Uncharacterized protein n=1 Tax=Schizopora paradoxa TaxID=27342 RepID=A0A0H2RXV9_9AGAM|nr:hypothetical protein SCHPADRAFT_847980 [Schizopora paradoxa]
MSSNSWGPNESASVVLSEEAWLQGAFVSSIAYGALLVLFIQCFSLLLKQTKRSNYRSKVPFLVIVFLIFMFGTFFMSTSMKFNQLSFIENRNYPGGPSAYENDMFAIPVDSLGNVSFTLSQWLCDALIIWRYMLIFKGCNAPIWIVVTLPVLLFLGSFVVGILFLLQLSATSPFVSSGINWTIPYFSISLAINIFVTIAIVARLLLFRRRIASVLGPNHGSQYTSVAAMIIESAALFSVFSILFLVPFGLNSSVSQIFLQSMGQVQACATILIILRAASGKAWSAETQTTLMSKHQPPRRTLGSIQMSKIGPFTSSGKSGSETAVGPCLNDSFSGSDFKSASSILAVNGVSIVKDVETYADAHSLEDSASDRV